MLPYFRLHHRRLFQQCLFLSLLSVRPVLRYCPDLPAQLTPDIPQRQRSTRRIRPPKRPIEEG